MQGGNKKLYIKDHHKMTIDYKNIGCPRNRKVIDVKRSKQTYLFVSEGIPCAMRYQQGLQEKFCTAEQDCFEAPGTG